MKTNFHNKNFGLSLAIKTRFKVTRKWPITLSTLLIKPNVHKNIIEPGQPDSCFAIASPHQHGTANTQVQEPGLPHEQIKQ